MLALTETAQAYNTWAILPSVCLNISWAQPGETTALGAVPLATLCMVYGIFAK
jgi:hypothetical protein